MKSEEEITRRLKVAKKDLKDTTKRFDKYDNHDDMELIPVYEAVVAELEWVLARAPKEER